MGLNAKIISGFSFLLILCFFISCQAKHHKEKISKEDVTSIKVNDSLIFQQKKDSLVSYVKIENDESYQIYDIDINKDGIKDKIANNREGSDLLFFIKNNNKYVNVYEGDNYTYDGIYFIDDIKSCNIGDNICCIKTYFNGSGGQNINYFIKYINNQWESDKSIIYDLSSQSNKICLNSKISKNEECIVLKEGNSATILNSFKLYTKEVKSMKNISEELLFTLMFNFDLNNKTLVNYNDIAYYLEKHESFKGSIFLLEKIVEKFPNRMVAYINLGDAYWGNSEQDKAIKAYDTYITQMKAKGKESKIPKRVFDRVQ